MHIHLNNPDLKLDNLTDFKLKHCVHIEFQLIDNKLYQRPNSKFLNLQYTILKSETFNTIVNKHLQLLYVGYMKT
jgi:hypothetical protein